MAIFSNSVMHQVQEMLLLILVLHQEKRILACTLKVDLTFKVPSRTIADDILFFIIVFQRK